VQAHLPGWENTVIDDTELQRRWQVVVQDQDLDQLDPAMTYKTMDEGGTSSENAALVENLKLAQIAPKATQGPVRTVRFANASIEAALREREAAKIGTSTDANQVLRPVATLPSPKPVRTIKTSIEDIAEMLGDALPPAKQAAPQHAPPHNEEPTVGNQGAVVLNTFARMKTPVAVPSLSIDSGVRLNTVTPPGFSKATSADLEAHDELDEAPESDYELIEEVGRGGMGIVYKARQTGLRREVALKVALEKTARQNAYRKFVEEALVTGALEHPNIVPVYDLVTTGQGHFGIAMKLVGGMEWKDLIHPDSHEANARAADYDLEDHLNILISVSNAVAYAHTHHIVHNDIKPANIMVGEFGEVLLMDWGCAVDVQDDASVTTLGKNLRYGLEIRRLRKDRLSEP